MRIIVEHLPSVDIALDPMAHPLVYADGNFIHGEALRKAAQAAE